MTSLPSWEAYLAERFPGYLLPEARGRTLPEEVAARFLASVGGAGHLSLLRAAGVLSTREEEVRDLALVHLPDLRRRLPRRREAEHRVRLGQLRGRLDVAATQRRWTAGRVVEIVAREPRLRRGPREDALLGAVVRRLLSLLRQLSDAGVLGRSGWGAALVPCAADLERALALPPLAGSAEEAITPQHEEAARGAPHPAYPLALALHRALRAGLDVSDRTLVARALARGALFPLADHTRFELAVLLRLVETLEAHPGWSLRRSPVLPGRRHVAELQRGDGAFVQLHFDQAVLPPGPCEAGLRRYLGRSGRLRPDLTVIAGAPGRAPRATVIEVKLSDDPSYLAEGYREAIVYAAEYGGSLTGWPKAILVTAASLGAPPRREDEVIAVGWDRWVPEEVALALLEGLPP